MPAPPSLTPRRRNARVGPMSLPATGREGPTPEWPLDTLTPEEESLWADLWVTPQAVAWEGMNWTRVVARYTRLCIKAEALDRNALAESRQLEDRLGLTPKAMRTLLWTIEDGEEEAKGDLVVVDQERWRNAAAG